VAVTRIVTTHYRYKRPPRRKKLVALEVPAVVKAADPAKASKRARADLPSKPVVNAGIKRAGAAATPPVLAANDDHRPALVTEPSVVTTSRKPREEADRPLLPMALPLSRKPVERDGDDYKRLKAAMARRLRGE
jgi:hypothetical protein